MKTFCLIFVCLFGPLPFFLAETTGPEIPEKVINEAQQINILIHARNECGNVDVLLQDCELDAKNFENPPKCKSVAVRFPPGCGQILIKKRKLVNN